MDDGPGAASAGETGERPALRRGRAPASWLRAGRGDIVAGCVGLLVAVALLVGIALVTPSQFGLWQTVGRWTGTPQTDAGPVDFAQVRRRSSPNDALICPADRCPLAKPDVEPPVFTIAASRLAEKIRDVALAEPRVERLDDGSVSGSMRFVQRSALMHFPDIVDVTIVPLTAGASTLAMYSRSLVGRSDIGVNRQRLERWLAALSK